MDGRWRYEDTPDLCLLCRGSWHPPGTEPAQDPDSAPWSQDRSPPSGGFDERLRLSLPYRPSSGHHVVHRPRGAKWCSCEV